MKIGKFLLIVLASCILICLLFSSCTPLELVTGAKRIAMAYPSDNPIETQAEEMIEEKTGLDIDISFWNPDNDKHKWSDYKDCDHDCDCSKE